MMEQVDHMGSVIENSFVVETHDCAHRSPSTAGQFTANAHDLRVPAPRMVYCQKYASLFACLNQFGCRCSTWCDGLFAKDQARLQPKRSTDIVCMAVRRRTDADHIEPGTGLDRSIHCGMAIRDAPMAHEFHTTCFIGIYTGGQPISPMTPECTRMGERCGIWCTSSIKAASNIAAANNQNSKRIRTRGSGHGRSLHLLGLLSDFHPNNSHPSAVPRITSLLTRRPSTCSRYFGANPNPGRIARTFSLVNTSPALRSRTT